MLSIEEPEKKIIRIPKPKTTQKKNIKTKFKNIIRIPKEAGYRPQSILPIVKKELTTEELNKWLSTPSGFVGALTCDMEGNKSVFYDYQQDHMDNPASFRNIDKARQVGFSYTFAAESLAKCHLKKLQTSIFVSYNQEEANEKVRFARVLYDSMPTRYKKTLVVDNKQSLEFEYNGKRTRILSYAQRQPRGKGNNTDVYLDEFAHMMWAYKIYVAAIPIITRGTGVLTVASTPLGKGNLHYDISTDKEKYDMFSRMRIYWWDCPELCIDITEARKHAHNLDVEERIARFATNKLSLLFHAMDTEDFMQEYELYYADSTLSYYPLDLIKSCVFEYEDRLSLEDNIDPDEAPLAWVEDTEESNTIMDFYNSEDICWYFDQLKSSDINNDTVEIVKDFIDKFLMNMNEKSFGRTLLVGVDIGRKRDTSEISIFEQIEVSGYNIHVERLAIELDNIKFRSQKNILRHIINRLPVRSMKIDATGIGANIAEDLESEYPDIIEGINFTIENKAEMAKNLRFRLEDRTVCIYNDSSSIKQIHSIKKTVTESSNVKYGTEKNVKGHHGDKFWSKALASSAGDSYDRTRIIKSLFKTTGERIFSSKSSTFLQTPRTTPFSGAGYGVRPGIREGIQFDNPMWEMFADTHYHGD